MRISDWSSDVCSADLVSRLRSTRTGKWVRFNARCFCIAGLRRSLEPWRATMGKAADDDRSGNDGARTRHRALVQQRAAVDCRAARAGGGHRRLPRSEKHTSELQSLMRISYAVFCFEKKTVHLHKIRTP